MTVNNYFYRNDIRFINRKISRGSVFLVFGLNENRPMSTCRLHLIQVHNALERENFEHITLHKVNANNSSATSFLQEFSFKNFQIQTLPCSILYHDGKMIDFKAGCMIDDNIVKMLKKITT